MEKKTILNLQIMKTLKYFLLTLFVLVSLSSCQKEIVEINNQEPEGILNNDLSLSNMLLELTSESLNNVSTFVSINYPITASTYNTDYQLIDVKTISSDPELANLINEMRPSVITSFNFPISLIYRNETTVEVNNKEELETAIEVAAENCISTNPCISSELYACNYGNASGDVAFNLQDADKTCAYLMTMVRVFYENLDDLANNINPIDIPTNYKISTSSLVYLKHYNLNDHDNFRIFEIKLTVKDCSCFEGREITLEDGNGDGIQVFDLTSPYNECVLTANLSVSYHTSLEDAQSVTDPISTPTHFTNTTPYSQTIYVAIWNVSNPASAETVFELKLIVSPN